MAQQIVKLSKKELEKLTKLLTEKQVLATREADLMDIILGNAGIELPVDSVNLNGDQLVVTKTPKEEPVEEAVLVTKE